MRLLRLADMRGPPLSFADQCTDHRSLGLIAGRRRSVFRCRAFVAGGRRWRVAALVLARRVGVHGSARAWYGMGDLVAEADGSGVNVWKVSEGTGTRCRLKEYISRGAGII